jgi:protein-disulfide isomerase
MIDKKKSNKDALSKLTKNRAGRGRTVGIQVGVGLVIVGLIAAIGVSIGIKKHNQDKAAAAQAANAAGPAIYHDGYLHLGNPNAKVKLSITEDFACSACKAFEAGSGAYVGQLIAAGKVDAAYRPIALIDTNFQGVTDYSARSAGAAACVAEGDVSKWYAFHTLLFDNQPAEGAPGGLPDSQLAQYAKQAGVDSPGVAQCITSDKYKQYVENINNQALKEIRATPTIKINGVQYAWSDPAGFQAAITKAEAGK